jgi:hypothetical protein
MFTTRALSRFLVVVTTFALYATASLCTAGHGGGHHFGTHGGAHDGGEYNHHAYHPSHHHSEHHEHHGDRHHDGHHVAHHDHHHSDWHHGGWGPGYWGGAGLVYGGWNGWGYGGGNTFVDNSTSVAADDNTPAGDVASDSSNDAADSGSDDTATNDQSNGFPVDNWPELGIRTYAGEYGASQGQVITSVIPGSAAERAGLVAGDVILTFNGQPVPSADDLDSAMGTANGKFEVSVWDARTGRKSTLAGALDAAGAAPATKTTAFTPAQ